MINQQRDSNKTRVFADLKASGGRKSRDVSRECRFKSSSGQVEAEGMQF